jgi:photosystem II stability/assembly factor-like uncharacterized protein
MEAERVAAKAARRAAGYAKPDRPDGYDLAHAELRTPIGETSIEAPADYKMRALEALEAAPRVRLSSTLRPEAGEHMTTSMFNEVGPGNVSGRTRAFVVDSRDATTDTWFAGGVGGGIWRTTNAGISWAHITPDLPNLAITALAQSKSDPQVFYAGTGEGFGNTDAIRGDGIFKSIDGGVTWTQLASTVGEEFDWVNRLVADPTDADVVVAATNAALFRTTDGGATWTNVYDPAGRVQQVVAAYGAFSPLYASVRDEGVIKSTDGGVT